MKQVIQTLLVTGEVDPVRLLQFHVLVGVGSAMAVIGLVLSAIRDSAGEL